MKQSSNVKQRSQKNIIRICLLSYDYRNLDKSAKALVEIVKGTGSVVRGPIPLPTKIEKFTVLRSPHVNKTSREQFEIRTHRRVLEIANPSSHTTAKLRVHTLPAGVSITIKVMNATD